MKKTIFFLLLFLSIFQTANGTDELSPYEETYPEIGYKTVEAALNEMEQHFKKELQLPLRVPPIAFTHYFGRFNDLDGDLNDLFEVTFIHDQLSENHYKIDVRPTKYKILMKEKDVLKSYT
ncbi:hypothetical protein [Psychrobacillus sp. NPDC096389]|uniref:hypothetical protein n=1 Tax=Psychrobacillus sp. NPDC096389 TaxID=3364490 RepID=UPI003809134B